MFVEENIWHSVTLRPRLDAEENICPGVFCCSEVKDHL